MSAEEVKSFERLQWNHQLPEQENRNEKTSQDRRIVDAAKSVSQNRDLVVAEIGEFGASERSVRVIQEKFIDLTLEDEQFQKKCDIDLLEDFHLELRRLSALQAEEVDADARLSVDNALGIIANIKDINIINEYGCTALHLACTYGIMQLALHLLIRGIRIDIRNIWNEFPFLYLRGGNGDTILHCFLNQPTKDLDEQIAIQEKRVEFCRKLLHSYPSLLNKTNNDGISPLMYACTNGDVECVKFFVMQPGINLDTSDSFYKTAAHYAIESKNPEIIESVLKNYTSVIKDIPIDKPIDRDGNTLLHYAFKISNLKFVQVDIESHHNMHLFFVLNSFGVTPISHILTSKDLVLNEKLLRTTKCGIDSGDSKLLELFTDEIARLDQDTKDFFLSLSITWLYYDIAKQLLKKGADCNSPINQKVLNTWEVMSFIRDPMPNGSNVLMFLLYANYLHQDDDKNSNDMTLTILKECYVNFDITAGGLNLLHFACLGGKVEILKELIGRNLNIEAVGTEGRWENVSVLMSAVIGKSAEIVDILLERLKPLDGLAAFNFAIEQRNPKIVYTFLQHNFPVDHTMKNFDFLIKVYHWSEKMTPRFKVEIQKMIHAHPEFLLRIARGSNGKELFKSLGNNEELDNIAENFIQEGVVINVFPDFATVISDLSKDNINELRKYLREAKLSRIGITLLRSHINAIAKEDKVTEAWKIFENTFLRYEQISKASFEKQGIQPHENFEIALHIESVIVKIEEATGRFFDKKSMQNMPRSIIFYERKIVILSLCKFSNIYEEGGEKRISSAALVSLDNLLADPENVVVAKIKPSKLKGDGVLRAEDYRLRLRYEWEILSKFKGMKGFVQGHHFSDIRSSNGNIRYIIEQYEGSIFKFVGGILPLEQQINVAEQAVLCIKTMHDMKIVHTDIKPENILYKIDADKNIKIAFTDFSRSKVLKDRMRGGVSNSTPKYNPPEVVQVINKFRPPQLSIPEQYIKAEIFAIGLTLFELHYGLVFQIDTFKIELREYKRLYDKFIKSKVDFLESIERKRTLKERYEMIILKMLTYKPEDRITLGDVLQEIRNIAVVNL